MTDPASPAATVIDPRELARSGGSVGGRWPLARLPRLADTLTDTEGEVDWSLSGQSLRRADGGADLHLALSLQARVSLRCVRCLEPVPVAIDEERRYRLVANEQQALAQDPDDDEFDLLAVTPRLAAIDLLEDELIMALPLAPRHEDCRPPGSSDRLVGAGPADRDDGAQAESGRPNPFAVLARLRRPNPGPGSDENPA
ncbi:MAG: DUF177 domain-containing protein [Betaproteobacteria bacterium]|nr:DUF177 domain-containing protein [Betaproteobacteria bacterium]